VKNLIGNEIDVCFKSSTNSTSGDIRGILLEVTDSEIYVQNTEINNPFVWVIPRDNVKCYIISSLPSINKLICQNQTIEDNVQEIAQNEIIPPQQENILEIYINNELATTIPVPPTFKLDVWNENIMRILIGNPDVKALLAGKIQKSIDYYPGKVYIDIESEKSIVGQINTFSMSKDITTEYLNPSEMVTRFNSFLKKDSK
jgi:hypothetical protein